jgi:hypothetical protein
MQSFVESIFAEINVSHYRHDKTAAQSLDLAVEFFSTMTTGM